MKKLLIGLLLMGSFSSISIADEYLTVLGTCNDNKDNGPVTTKKGIVKFITEDTSISKVELIADEILSSDLTVAGGGAFYDKNSFFTLRISLEAIVEYNKKFNEELEAGTGIYKKENGFKEGHTP